MQCEDLMPHAPHNHLHTSGMPGMGESVYAKCDGVIIAPAPDPNPTRTDIVTIPASHCLIPLTAGAAEQLEEMAIHDQIDIIRSAINVGISPGESFKVNFVSRSTGLPYVEADADGEVTYLKMGSEARYFLATRASRISSPAPAPCVQVVTQAELDAIQRQVTDVDYIVNVLLPSIGVKMRQDEEHYGSDNHHELGTKGQFADIWRKIGPLKRQMWEGLPPTREGTREIVMDLIGHCLLTLAMLDGQEASAQ
jgi:hypothetical protein